MKSWRVLTWVILGVQVPFAIWMVAAMFSTSDDTNCSGEFADACKAGAAIGLGIGIAFVLSAWALTDIILGVIWMVTNTWIVTDKKSNDTVPGKVCPDCAETILADAKVCKHCGYRGVAPKSPIPAPKPAAAAPVAKWTVTCPLCNAEQRIPETAVRYTCGKCKQVNPAPD
jgi:ribosomal protein S27AE